MIGGEILVAALGDVFVEGTAKIAIAAGRKLGVLDEVGKAIRTTERRHGVGAGKALHAWVLSDDFERLPALATTAGTTDRDIVEPFRLVLHLSGLPSATTDDAHQILLTFAAEWRSESLRGEQAVAVHDELEASRFSDLRGVMTEQSDRIAEVQATLAKFVSANGTLTTTSPDSSALQQAYRDQINVARDLLQKGSLRAALEILQQIRAAKQFSELPVDVRFSASINVGVAYLRLGNLDEGVAAFEAALNLKPSDPIALSNASAAALRSGRLDDALRFARAAFDAGATDQRARINLIDVLEAMGNRSEADQYVLPVAEWQGDTAFLVAVAEMYSSLDRLADAESVARKAVESAPDNVAALGVLAASILANRPTALSRLERTRIAEADELLTKAITLSVADDDHAAASHLFTNRSALKGMQGQVNEGLDDAKQALFHDPKNSNAHLNKGLFHLQLSQNNEAVSELSQVTDEDAARKARVPLATAAFQLGQYELVRSTLSSVLSRPEERDFPDAADILLQTAEKSGATSELDEILEKLRSLRASHVLAAIPLANLARRSGRINEAIRLLDEARSDSHGDDRIHLAFELAFTYLQDSRYAEGAAVFETFVNETTDRLVMQRFVISLLNSGDWRNALQWARRLRNDGPPIPVVSEIEAMVLDATGDAAAARELYRQLADADPSNMRLRLREIASDVRLNDIENARSKLEKLTPESLGDDPQTLLMAAGLRDRLKLGGVMPFAYRALQLGYDEDEIHAAYLNFFLRHEDEVTEPPAVCEDCEVTLVTSEGDVTYTITSDPEEAKREHFFAPTSTVGSKLVGRTVGESVTIYTTAFGKERSGTVSSIRSKYAATFTRLLREYPERFPDSKSVQMGADDPERIIELVRKHDQHRREIEKLYRVGLIGLGGVAEMLSRSEIETLGMLITDPASRVMAFTGDAVEAERENTLLRDEPSLVLDLSALLTIHLLETVDDVRKTFTKLAAATHVLDVIDNFLSVQTLSKEEGLGLTVANDEVIAMELKPEQKEGRRKFVSTVKDFVTSISVLPAHRTAELSREDRERTIRRIGAAALASIAVAAENVSILCTDDLVTKAIAEHQWNVKCVSTSALLSYMRVKRLITDDKFVKVLGQLATFDYFFLRFTGDDLYNVLIANDVSISPPLTRLLSNLAGPDCDLKSAAVVLASFIRRTVTTLNVPQLRTMVVDLSATAIMRGRNPAEALAALRQALASAFILIPQLLIDVNRTLALWQKRAVLGF